MANNFDDLLQANPANPEALGVVTLLDPKGDVVKTVSELCIDGMHSLAMLQHSLSECKIY